jgi:hypothetical protein
MNHRRSLLSRASFEDRLASNLGSRIGVPGFIAQCVPAPDDASGAQRRHTC